MEDGQIEFNYEVDEVSPERIEIRYWVENGLGEAIYLVTPLVEWASGGWVANKNRIYRYIDPDGILHLTKRLWPVPDEVEVYEPELPEITKLFGRDRFEERVSVELPVKIMYPYRMRYRKKAGKDNTLLGSAGVERVNGVAFSIAMLSGDGVNGAEGGELRSYGSLLVGQTIFQGEVLDLGCEVEVKG